MINQANAARHELIGLEVEIASSPDPSYRGARGRVIDETRNTLVVSRIDSGRAIRVPKDGARFRFALPDGKNAEIDGSSIAFRPEDRVKRCR
jgi:ribonuclease P protein subunit POP4